jgi:hypothetical protein
MNWGFWDNFWQILWSLVALGVLFTIIEEEDEK